MGNIPAKLATRANPPGSVADVVEVIAVMVAAMMAATIEMVEEMQMKYTRINLGTPDGRFRQALTSINFSLTGVLYTNGSCPEHL